ALCERAVDCSLYPDLATCAATNIAGGTPEEGVNVVKQGNATYDPVAAAACVDALPRKCWTQSDWFLEQLQFLALPICRRAFTGRAPAGGACCSAFGYEPPTDSCSGVGAAQALSPLGAPCVQNGPAYGDYDLLCSPEGKCEAHLPIGANCADQEWQQC